MKPEKLLDALNDIDSDLIAGVHAPQSQNTRPRFTLLIAAMLVTAALTATAFASETISGWFHDFLHTKYVPESWLDADEIEDYSVELLAEPVSGIPAYFFGYRVKGIDETIDITVVSVRLRPESLIMFYYTDDPQLASYYYPRGIHAVLRDGTEVDLAPSAYGRVADDPNTLFWMECASEIPPADEIDYILLSDGAKIMAP